MFDRFERDADEYLAAHGLRVAADLLPRVREILTREARHEASAYAGTGTVYGNTDLMRICAAQLWHAGVVEDVLLIDRARATSMDATGAIDGQMLLGAGVARTKEFLAALGTDEARRILDYVVWLEEDYDAERYAASLDSWYRTA
ncbi:hypothetical protein Ais01nite_02830 [Asanoa ishikariensis]|uniref:Uncharacterized protein n=2 Tax=Asanoa ishikariensis TaxID=137265 RepID=A0A1H3TM25_9ACTN|nr:hypothetical protein Ais01nite_02830 [Asanoa ishikariensis]SDZ50705.1 hypothetical protein SAMN05421684_5950 [Asanoa ishikariensis]